MVELGLEDVLVEDLVDLVVVRVVVPELRKHLVVLEHRVFRYVEPGHPLEQHMLLVLSEWVPLDEVRLLALIRLVEHFADGSQVGPAF